MNREQLTQTALVFASLALSAALAAVPAQAQGNQRPLSDFIDAQGTNSCFGPPGPSELGFSTGIDKTNGNAFLTPTRFAAVDYTGEEGRVLKGLGIDLGTTLSGNVTERPLADGRALVTVDLHTLNALGWAINWDPFGPASQFNSNPLLFGARPQDLIANRAITPAVGNSHFRAVFTNTAPGKPLPSLVCINSSPDCPEIAPCPAGFEIDSLSIQAGITGPLHALAGLGPEGTPGRMDVTEIGLITAAISNDFKGPLRDAFPVESIALKAIGK